MIRFIGFLLMLLIPTFTLSAALFDEWVCTKPDVKKRSVLVNNHLPPSDLVCSVQYHKDGDSTLPWKAKNDATFCKRKAKELAEKLDNDGWNCTKTKTISDNGFRIVPHNTSVNCYFNSGFTNINGSLFSTDEPSISMDDIAYFKDDYYISQNDIGVVELTRCELGFSKKQCEEIYISKSNIKNLSGFGYAIQTKDKERIYILDNGTAIATHKERALIGSCEY